MLIRVSQLLILIIIGAMCYVVPCNINFDLIFCCGLVLILILNFFARD